MNRLYGAMLSRIRSPLRWTSVENCVRSAVRQSLTEIGDLDAHLFLRLFPLGGQNEEANGRNHGRQDDPRDIGGRRRRGDGHNRAKANRGRAGRGSGGDRVARVVGEQLGFALPVVRLDDALRFAAHGVNHAGPVVVELAGVLADHPALVLPAALGQVPSHRFPTACKSADTSQSTSSPTLRSTCCGASATTCCSKPR